MESGELRVESGELRVESGFASLTMTNYDRRAGGGGKGRDAPTGGKDSYI